MKIKCLNCGKTHDYNSVPPIPILCRRLLCDCGFNMIKTYIENEKAIKKQINDLDTKNDMLWENFEEWTDSQQNEFDRNLEEMDKLYKSIGESREYTFEVPDTIKELRSV